MSDAPVQPQYSWVCPECTRRVPNRFDSCRCGCARPEDFDAPAGDATVWGPPPPTSSKLPWIVLGFVALAAAGTLVALQVIPARPQPQAVAAATALESPTASATKPVAPSAPDAPSALDAPNALLAPLAPNSAPSALIAPIAPIAPLAPIAPDAPNSLEDVISRAIPAIVSIETRQGSGSGFFVAPRTVITNRHVVQDNVSVTVRLSSGQTLPGRVEKSSSESDLAIVRVDSALPSQPVLVLGSVNDVRPGQEVIAIGLALGVFQNSVTRGIISAIRRADRTVMLQTDAAINPGNSGGPLLNRQGQVVGINTLKVGGAAESLGFAVAADHARALLGGGQTNAPFGTSAQQNQQLAPAFGARSSTDIAREAGTKRYGQIVEAVSRQAVQLDAYWSRIKVNCTVRVAPGYDREWFGLWDGRAKLDTPDTSCGSAVQELEAMATQVRTVMGTAQEEARRASVLPGELRDIRRRYRMDWPGFDR
jgi:S1-C subfamily serine protease